MTVCHFSALVRTPANDSAAYQGWHCTIAPLAPHRHRQRHVTIPCHHSSPLLTRQCVPGSGRWHADCLCGRVNCRRRRCEEQRFYDLLGLERAALRIRVVMAVAREPFSVPLGPRRPPAEPFSKRYDSRRSYAQQPRDGPSGAAVKAPLRISRVPRRISVAPAGAADGQRSTTNWLPGLPDHGTASGRPDEPLAGSVGRPAGRSTRAGL